MRRLVSCHHLAGVGENGSGEQAEGVHSWVQEEQWGAGNVSGCGDKMLKILSLHMREEMKA